MKRFKVLFVILLASTTFSCTEESDTPRSSSAEANVLVLEQQFIIAGLNRSRQIRIYLPPDYDSTNQDYPVLYMHDGQNLFDDSTSYVGEWGIDESLNQLARESDFRLIVVGIDNGQEKRMNELSPWENKEFGPAEGEQYMKFIVNQIKPYIDNTYRTLSDRDNTAIMGSSMGGLISHYAIYNYPQVFSKAGIFSPSYWYSADLYPYTKQNPVPKDARLFLEIGMKEGNAVEDTQKMYDFILSTGHPKDNISIIIDPDGEHTEGSWRKQFVPAIKWLFEQ
jgi:predicted alpha/beta superfamily hydrolase